MPLWRGKKHLSGGRNVSIPINRSALQLCPRKASVLLLSLSVFLAIQPATAAQTDDEASLRALVDKFSAAYHNHDLDSLIALWSEKSPDRDPAKKKFEQEFAAARIDTKNFIVRRIGLERDKAFVRLVRDATGAEGTGEKSTNRSANVKRTLRCVREAGTWRILSYLSSEEDLAAAIAAADTEDQRKSLVAAEKDLRNVELGKALRDQANSLSAHGDYSKAMSIFELVLSYAPEIKDRDGIASALDGIGNIYFEQGKFDEALENHQKSLKIYEEDGDK